MKTFFSHVLRQGCTLNIGGQQPLFLGAFAKVPQKRYFSDICFSFIKRPKF